MEASEPGDKAVGNRRAIFQELREYLVKRNLLLVVSTPERIADINGPELEEI
jgi:hypothetical protein